MTMLIGRADITQLQTQQLPEPLCHQSQDLDLLPRLQVGAKRQHKNPHISPDMEDLALTQCKCGIEIEVWSPKDI